MFNVAAQGTYARWLVHIDPGAIDIQTSLGVVEAFELSSPVALCLGIEPI